MQDWSRGLCRTGPEVYLCRTGPGVYAGLVPGFMQDWSRGFCRTGPGVSAGLVSGFLQDWSRGFCRTGPGVYAGLVPGFMQDRSLGGPVSWFRCREGLVCCVSCRCPWTGGPASCPGSAPPSAPGTRPSNACGRTRAEVNQSINQSIGFTVGRKPLDFDLHLFEIIDIIDRVADPDPIGSGMFSSDPYPVLSFRIRIQPYIKTNKKKMLF